MGRNLPCSHGDLSNLIEATTMRFCSCSDGLERQGLLKKYPALCVSKKNEYPSLGATLNLWQIDLEAASGFLLISK
jgi:hypothetical protein